MPTPPWEKNGSARMLRSHSEPLKAEFHPELELEWVIRVTGRIESQNRVGRQTQVRSSIKRVQVFDVGAIEHVEHVTAKIGAQAFADLKTARHPHVEAGIAGSLQGIAAQVAGTVRER